MKHSKKFRCLLAMVMSVILFIGNSISLYAAAPSDMLVYETDDTELRILLTSDVHYTYLKEEYGPTGEERMQLWVDSIKKEHAEKPFDLIFIVGDLSLDHWEYGGSVIEDGVSTTKDFIKYYVSQLPKDVPVYIMPGNHEQQSDEQWFEMTGNHRRGSIVLGDTLFICPDSYGEDLDPDYNHDGTHTFADVEYIKGVMEQYPDKDVYIVSHYIYPGKESKEFKELVASDRVKGMFMGHTHENDVLYLDWDWGGKTIAQTGNFSYAFGDKETVCDNFWGYRELVITPDVAYSQYITVESDAVIKGEYVHFDRQTSDAVLYYGEDPGNLGLLVDPIGDSYTVVNDKIDQSNIDGDEGTSDKENFDKLLDGNIHTKWCLGFSKSDAERTIQWAMTEPVALDGYAFVTGNDIPGRDPKAWTLYGTNDPDGEWVVLSTVAEGELPEARKATSNVFDVENTEEYSYYKLTISDNRDKTVLYGMYYQASELLLLVENEGDSGNTEDGGNTGDSSSSDNTDNNASDTGNSSQNATSGQENSDSQKQVSQSSNPATGDNSSIGWWGLVLAAAVGFIAVLLGLKRAKSR